MNEPNEVKPLLAILEVGACPDITALAARAGFAAVLSRTMRKGLPLLRTLHPAVVVAEFVYGPVYGSRISNFESLMAGLQRDAPYAKLVALVDKEDRPHLERLEGRFPLFAMLGLPLRPEALLTALQQAAMD